MKKIGFFLVIIVVLVFANTAFAQGPGGDWESEFSCQNTDPDDPANITISFYSEGSETSDLDYDDTIPAGGNKSYYTPTSPPGLPSPFLGSAVVSSDIDVVCIVNSQAAAVGTSEDPYRFAMSSGLSVDETSTPVYAPQIEKDFWGWNSFIVVQNASSISTTVQITYKDKDGNDIPAATESAPIPGYSNKVFYQDSNANLPSNFIGAAKIESITPDTTPLAVHVSFYNSGDDSSTSQFHGYNGMISGSETLLVPRLLRRYYGYNSGLSIQNIGSIDTSVTITFTFSGSSYITTTGVISQGAALPLYLPNVGVLNPVDSSTMSQRFGNAIIKANASGGQIIANINDDNRGLPADNDGEAIPVERIGQGSTYNAINTGSETQNLYFPQLTNAYNTFFSGGFQVTNTTDAAGTCDITYYGAATADETAVPIAAKGSFPRYGPNITNLPSGYNGGVFIHCTVDVIGIGNMAVAPGSSKYGDSYTQGNLANR